MASGAVIRGGASTDRKTSVRKACSGQRDGSGRFARAEIDCRANATFSSLKSRRAGKMNLHALFKFSRIVRREVASRSGGGDNGPVWVYQQGSARATSRAQSEAKGAPQPADKAAALPPSVGCELQWCAAPLHLPTARLPSLLIITARSSAESRNAKTPVAQCPQSAHNAVH